MEERRLEERRAKLDDMEASLTAKHAALDVKMQAWVRRARKDGSWQLPRMLSASARWATCVKEVDLQPVRQLCEHVERKQAWLERRAHELADLEARLERRLAAVEQDLIDDPEGVEEGGLSEATLQEAKELLSRRRPRHEMPRPKSRLEIAWLSTLRSDVESAELLTWVAHVDDADEDPRHFASPLALKWAEEGRSSLACVSAALVVRVESGSLTDAVDAVTSAGGHVARVDATHVAAVFCGDDDDEDWEAAVATLAALSCAALPGAAATVAVGPVALVDVRLALDERWLCACGEAVALAASASSSTGVRVTAATAARLVQRGWPRGVFSATDDDNFVAVARATRPPPMKPKRWTAAVVDDAQVAARAPGLALAAALAATSSHHLAARNGTARRYGGRRVESLIERQATFVCARLRCAGRDDEDLETVACATNAAMRAFGGLCCDLALDVVEDDWGLELTAVFPGEDAAGLARTAALAVDVALARLVPYHRVGVASGSARVAVLGTTQRHVAVSSPAKTLAATLASQRQRVVIDGDTEPAGAVPLCPLSFPASEPAAVLKSDRFRAAVTLIDVDARPLWRSTRVGATAKLASAVVNNLVPGGRKRRAVTRDVATTALHAYRLAFACIKVPSVVLGESVEVPWETWSQQKPLSAAAFAALAPALPARDVYDLDALWIRSRGVPIRVSTLALAWASCGSRDTYARGAAVPSAVRDVALARLAELAPPTQQLLRAAAVGAGAGGASTLRASVLAVPALKDAFLGQADDFDDRFRAALDELQATGWLRRTADAYSLDDAVAADAVYESTPAPRRRAVHAAHAAALRTSLETSGSAKDDADVLRLAHHAVLARDADSAFAAVAEIVARGGPNFLLAVATHKLQNLGVPDALPPDRVQALIPLFRDCRAAILALRATRVATRVLAAAAAFKRRLKRR